MKSTLFVPSNFVIVNQSENFFQHVPWLVIFNRFRFFRICLFVWIAIKMMCCKCIPNSHPKITKAKQQQYWKTIGFIVKRIKIESTLARFVSFFTSLSYLKWFPIKNYMQKNIEFPISVYGYVADADARSLYIEKLLNFYWSNASECDFIRLIYC